MKSITKKLSVSLLSAAALALSFSAVKAYGAANAEEVTAETASASMVYGASVRVNGDDYTQNGIRFSMMMNQADYTAVKAETNPVFGVMIVPQAYNIAGDSAKMLAILNGTDEEYSVDASAEDKKQIWNVSGDSMLYFEANEEENRAAGYYFSGVMVNVQQDNLDRRFVGVGYYGYGDEIKLAAFNQNNIENNTRSMVKVAYEAAQTETENAAWLNANYVQKCTYAVVLDKHNGEENATQTVHYGEKLATPVAPDREGYELDGWYVGGKKYSFDTPVRGGGTLHAVWKQDITSEAAVGTLKNNVTAETQSIATEFNEVKKLTDESGNAIAFTFGADKKLTVQSSAVSALAAGEYNFCVWTEDYAYTKVKVAVAEEVADGGFENVTRISDSQIIKSDSKSQVFVSSEQVHSGTYAMKVVNHADSRWASVSLLLNNEMINAITEKSLLTLYMYVSSQGKTADITGFNARISTYKAGAVMNRGLDVLYVDNIAVDTWIKLKVNGSELQEIKTNGGIAFYNEIIGGSACQYTFYVDDITLTQYESAVFFNTADSANRVSVTNGNAPTITNENTYIKILNNIDSPYTSFKIDLGSGFTEASKGNSIITIKYRLDTFECTASSYNMRFYSYKEGNAEGGLDQWLKQDNNVALNTWLELTISADKISKITENALWFNVEIGAQSRSNWKLDIHSITMSAVA